MDAQKRIASSFLSLGIIFLVTGFIQQGFVLDFSSGLISLGFIFALSGLVALGLGKGT